MTRDFKGLTCVAGRAAVRILPVKNSDRSSQQNVDIVPTRTGWRNVLVGLVVIALLGLGVWVLPGLVPAPQESNVGGVQRPDLRKTSKNTLANDHKAGLPQHDVSLRVEVCGLGRFSVNANEAGIRKAHDLAIEQAKEANIQSLLLSADPAARAAGLVLRMAEIAQRGAFERVAAAETCETQRKNTGGAPPPSTCTLPLIDGEAILAQQRLALAPWVEQLAAIASVSEDPKVVAQAVRACEGQSALRACHATTAERWARLDPGNLAPWIRILNNARTRQDAAGVNEAMHQMAVSKHASNYDLFAWMKLATQADTGTDLQRLVSIEQMQAMHLLPSLEISGLLEECKKSRVTDANRRQLCDKTAANLVEKSDSYFSATVGAGIGHGVGWSNTKLAAIRAERVALQQAHGESLSAWFTAEGAQKLDCKSVARLRSTYGLTGQWGEMAAGRALAKASGLNIATRVQALLPEELRRLEPNLQSAQQQR